MDHLSFQSDRYEKRMNEADERPTKQRRVSSPASLRDKAPGEDPSDQLQNLVQQLSLMPLSSYFKTRAIDKLFQKISCSLEQLSSAEDHHLLAQVHSLLLHWLDYIITSLKEQDIAANDVEEDKIKVVATVSHISDGLKEVYRCSQHSLHNYEALYILIRSLMNLAVPYSNHNKETTSLLQIVEIVVQHVHPSLLPQCLQQQFVLCLVGACDSGITTEDSNNEVISRRHSQRGASNTAAQNILFHLVRFCETEISVYAETALSTLVEGRTSMPVAATSSQLFHLQCVLRQSRHRLYEDNVDLIPSLIHTVLTRAGQSDDLCRYQALDCIVTMASRHNESDKETSLSSSLMEGLLQVLTDSGTTPFNLALRFKAIDGLHFLLDSDDSRQSCILLLMQGDKDLKLKRFISSMFEISKDGCGHRWHDNDTFGELGHVININNSSVVIAASEILLSFITISLGEIDQFMIISPSHLVAICTAFLQQHLNSEHVVYLTVRTVCHDNRKKFFEIAQMYPELLSALAGVISYDNSSLTTKRDILYFLQELLRVRPTLTTVVARQSGVVEAVTYVASSQARREDELFPPDMHHMAVNLLFTLASDVCNRRILARQSRVLVSMIQFVRQQAAIGDYYSRGEIQNTLNEGESTPTLTNRAAMKERILQLAAVI